MKYAVWPSGTTGGLYSQTQGQCGRRVGTRSPTSKSHHSEAQGSIKQAGLLLGTSLIRLQVMGTGRVALCSAPGLAQCHADRLCKQQRYTLGRCQPSVLSSLSLTKADCTISDLTRKKMVPRTTAYFSVSPIPQGCLSSRYIDTQPSKQASLFPAISLSLKICIFSMASVLKQCCQQQWTLITLGTQSCQALLSWRPLTQFSYVVRVLQLFRWCAWLTCLLFLATSLVIQTSDSLS